MLCNYCGHPINKQQLIDYHNDNLRRILRELQEGVYCIEDFPLDLRQRLFKILNRV